MAASQFTLDKLQLSGVNWEAAMEAGVVPKTLTKCAYIQKFDKMGYRA